MESRAATDKIIMNFGWVGPNARSGGSRQYGGLDILVIDLIFQNAKSDICVNLPENISPTIVQNFPFTCTRYTGEGESRKIEKVTTPDLLNVTIEQIRNLSLRAGFFEESQERGPVTMDNAGKLSYERKLIRSNDEVPLQLPEELEVGGTYTLVVKGERFKISASLVKEEVLKAEAREQESAEYRARVGMMGEALIEEGIRNLGIVVDGRAAELGLDSPAEVVAHGIQGVIRAGQQMQPAIQVPTSKPSANELNFEDESVADLQRRFEAAITRDRQYEVDRMRASFAGDITEVNRILELENANSQLVVSLSEALKNLGAEAEVPATDAFLALQEEALQLQMQALQGAQDKCILQ